jgi:hypothetical protein
MILLLTFKHLKELGYLIFISGEILRPRTLQVHAAMFKRLTEGESYMVEVSFVGGWII